MGEIIAKAPPIPAPDSAYIKRLRTTLQSRFQDQDNKIETARQVRTLEMPVSLPEELRRVDVEVRDPTAADEVARVTATLTLNRPKLDVTAASSSEHAQANAELRKKWTEQTLIQAGRRIVGIDTFNDAVEACVGDGGACTKLLFDPDTWEERFNMRNSSAWVKNWLELHPDDPIEDEEDEETRTSVRKTKALKAMGEAVENAKKGAGVPFTWLSVDIKTVYPTWSGTDLSAVIEVSRRPVDDVMRRYGLSVALGDDEKPHFVKNIGLPLSEDVANALGETVEWVEYWDRSWCAYMVTSNLIEGEYFPIKVFRHGYPGIPYFFAPGWRPNFWKGYKVGWGVAESKLWLVRFRSFLYTLLAQAAAQDVGTPIIDEAPDPATGVYGESNKPMDHYQWPMGSVMEALPGHKVHPLFTAGPIAQTFQQLLSEVSGLIDQLNTPRVNSNIGSGLEGAGFAIAQVLMEARTKHNPYVSSLERMMDDVTTFLWKLVRIKVKETVWVRAAETAGPRSENWLGVGPDELSDAVGHGWHLDPEQPSAKIIESRYWTELINAGLASLEQAMKALGFNPVEVRMGIARDQIRSGPVYQQWLQKRVFEEMNRGDILAEQEAEMAVQTGMVPGMPPMMPPQGPGAMGGQFGPPDFTQLAMSPGGAGGGMPIPQNGGGVGPGAVLPTAGATASVQRVGP